MREYGEEYSALSPTGKRCFHDVTELAKLFVR